MFIKYFFGMSMFFGGIELMSSQAVLKDAVCLGDFETVRKCLDLMAVNLRAVIVAEHDLIAIAAFLAADENIRKNKSSKRSAVLALLQGEYSSLKDGSLPLEEYM